METPLWNGGPVLHRAPGVFPLGTDSIILSDFARPGTGDRILDLGAGGGALSVLLGWQRPDLHITALEMDPDACALAGRNLRDNGICANLLEADLRQYRSVLPAGTFRASPYPLWKTIRLCVLRSVVSVKSGCLPASSTRPSGIASPRRLLEPELPR